MTSYILSARFYPLHYSGGLGVLDQSTEGIGLDVGLAELAV
jgi:hypothetical protein